MERSSILMMAAMATYLLSMVEVSSMAFVPGSHQGTGNSQLRGAGSAGATRHASFAGGAAEPLVGQCATCLRALAAMLSVSAASLSIRGQAKSRSQSRVIVKAKGAGSEAAPKKSVPAPAKKPEAKKAAPEQPKKKQEAPATEAKKAAPEEPKKKQEAPATEAKKAAPEEPKKKKEAPATEAKKAAPEQPKKKEEVPAAEGKKAAPEEPKKKEEAPATEGKKAAPEEPKKKEEAPPAEEKKKEDPPAKEEPAPAKEEKKAPPPPAPKEEKKAPPPPAPKKEKKPEAPLSIKEQIAARGPYEEKFDGLIPMEKINAKFRQRNYEGQQQWQIDLKALAALKDGPAKQQAMERYKRIALTNLGQVNIAAAPLKNHSLAFFAEMVIEAAKAQGQMAEVSKDLLELGKLLTGDLGAKIKGMYEGAAGDDELVKALLNPISSDNKVVKTLITYLLNKGRLHQLKDVCLEFSILCNMKASLIPITVKSQAALSSSQKKKVEDALADGLNSPLKNLNIGYEVDTDILAGVRVMFDFDDPINKENPRRTLDFDFKNVITKSLGREFAAAA